MEGGKKRLKVATSLFYNPISLFLSLVFHSARGKRQTSSIQFLIRDFLKIPVSNLHVKQLSRSYPSSACITTIFWCICYF